MKPGLRIVVDSQEITKYLSNQKVNCRKQWQTDELADVLCSSGTYETVFWWFLGLNQFVRN